MVPVRQPKAPPGATPSPSTFPVFTSGYSADQLAFLAGVTALAAFEIIEWLVAVVLWVGLGHALASDCHRQALRDFGEALEEA